MRRSRDCIEQSQVEKAINHQKNSLCYSSILLREADLTPLSVIPCHPQLVHEAILVPSSMPTICAISKFNIPVIDLHLPYELHPRIINLRLLALRSERVRRCEVLYSLYYKSDITV